MLMRLHPTSDHRLNGTQPDHAGAYNVHTVLRPARSGPQLKAEASRLDKTSETLGE
jgi:hypothetical protein